MRRCLPLLLVLIVAVVAGRARADDASEAQLQYELGVSLYEQRKFAEAVERFIASNRLVPNANVVFNIAQTYKVMGRAVEAYNWYETYLLDFELDEEQQAKGKRHIDRLAPRVAVARVRTDPPGAELFIDRVDLGSVGEAPRRVAVEPGEHRIIARLEGHHPAETEVTLERGKVEPVSLELQPIVGTLRVTSDPAGATVHAEGMDEPLGQTPLRTSLDVGRWTLHVEKEGHLPRTVRATVREGEATSVSAELRPDPERIAVLSVLGAPEDARVQLDDQPVGQVPLTLDELEPGPRRIEVRAPGMQPWSSPLVLEAGSATRVSVDLAEADAGPWAGWRWLGYGGGGTLLLTGAAVAIGARVQRGRFFDDANPTRAQLDAVHRKNVTADVLMGLGLLSVGITITWDLLRSPPPTSTGRVEIDR